MYENNAEKMLKCLTKLFSNLQAELANSLMEIAQMMEEADKLRVKRDEAFRHELSDNQRLKIKEGRRCLVEKAYAKISAARKKRATRFRRATGKDL
jgi:hypothetical protein